MELYSHYRLRTLLELTLLFKGWELKSAPVQLVFGSSDICLQGWSPSCLFSRLLQLLQHKAGSLRVLWLALAFHVNRIGISQSSVS